MMERHVRAGGLGIQGLGQRDAMSLLDLFKSQEMTWTLGSAQLATSPESLTFQKQ